MESAAMNLREVVADDRAGRLRTVVLDVSDISDATTLPLIESVLSSLQSRRIELILPHDEASTKMGGLQSMQRILRAASRSIVGLKVGSPPSEAKEAVRAGVGNDPERSEGVPSSPIPGAPQVFPALPHLESLTLECTIDEWLPVLDSCKANLRRLDLSLAFLTSSGDISRFLSIGDVTLGYTERRAAGRLSPLLAGMARLETLILPDEILSYLDGSILPASLETMRIVIQNDEVLPAVRTLPAGLRRILVDPSRRYQNWQPELAPEETARIVTQLCERLPLLERVDSTWVRRNLFPLPALPTHLDGFVFFGYSTRDVQTDAESSTRSLLASFAGRAEGSPGPRRGPPLGGEPCSLPGARTPSSRHWEAIAMSPCVWEWADNTSVLNYAPTVPSAISLALLEPGRHHVGSLRVGVRGLADIDVLASILRLHPELRELAVFSGIDYPHLRDPFASLGVTPDPFASLGVTPSSGTEAAAPAPIPWRRRADLITTEPWSRFVEALRTHPGLESVAHDLNDTLTSRRDRVLQLEVGIECVRTNAWRREQGRDRAAWAVVLAGMKAVRGSSMTPPIQRVPWYFYSIEERVIRFLGAEDAPQLVYRPV